MHNGLKSEASARSELLYSSGHEDDVIFSGYALNTKTLYNMAY